MGQRLMRGQRANVGDWIQDDEQKVKWVAEKCPYCKGSGNESNGHMIVDCSECFGLKLYWKEVEYVG